MTTRVLGSPAPPLRIDARSLQPAALAALSAADRDVADLIGASHRAGRAVRRPPRRRRRRSDPDPRRRPVRFDAVGAGLAGGRLEVHGPVGDSAGLGMSDGVLHIAAAHATIAGCSLRGGWLEVDGDIGDFGACALPGDIDGMRGGTLCVHGRAGAAAG
jgi:formylmethanofuran dehydrogenase subunit C